MGGKLVEGARFFADAQNGKCEIGEGLPVGVYFIKAKGYTPAKIIKLGNMRDKKTLSSCVRDVR